MAKLELNTNQSLKCNPAHLFLFLGNIILNIILSPSIPLQRQGKNNVSMICVPNPPVDSKADPTKPVPMLVRVKTAEDADQLLQKMNEVRKKE